MAPAHRRGEAASYFSVALYSGLALGPALGEHLADSAGFHRVWVVAGLASIAAAVFGLGTPQVSNRTAERPTSLLHPAALGPGVILLRSEEHTSELQSLMRISYAVFCLIKKTTSH